MQRAARVATKVTPRIRSAAEKLTKLRGVGTATEFPGVRRLPIVRYPYVIFYSIEAGAEEIVVLHVRHTSRRPATPGDIEQTE